MSHNGWVGVKRAEGETRQDFREKLRSEFDRAERGYAVNTIYDPEKIQGYSWVTQVMIEARNHPPHKEALFRLMRPYL